MINRGEKKWSPTGKTLYRAGAGQLRGTLINARVGRHPCLRQAGWPHDGAFLGAKGRACTQKCLPPVGRRYSTQAWFLGAGMKAKISFDNWCKF
jgi:hypothetical protein